MSKITKLKSLTLILKDVGKDIVILEVQSNYTNGQVELNKGLCLSKGDTLEITIRKRI